LRWLVSEKRGASTKRAGPSIGYRLLEVARIGPVQRFCDFSDGRRGTADTLAPVRSGYVDLVELKRLDSRVPAVIAFARADPPECGPAP